MTWFIEYVDDGVFGTDIISGKTILDAKRNLIAKIGSAKITFKGVTKRELGAN